MGHLGEYVEFEAFPFIVVVLVAVVVIVIAVVVDVVVAPFILASTRGHISRKPEKSNHSHHHPKVKHTPIDEILTPINIAATQRVVEHQNHGE